MIAVVTGAGRGIGRAICVDLAKRGCDIALLGRTIESLGDAAAEVVALRKVALAVRCDVADPVAVEAAAASACCAPGCCA
jgi:NAD(P)-dependent dehydrogenase (short-subunit alcohol dehydrogenase family)